MKRLPLWLIAAGVGAAWLGTAQNPTPETPVFRSSARLIQISVVARQKGQPAAGLERDDFEVFDNGKRQSISFFGVNDLARLASAAATAAPVSPSPSSAASQRHVYTNQTRTPAELSGNATVILVDALNTGAEDQNFARDQILRFLTNQLKPEDRVALYVLGTQLVIAQDFTSDLSRLLPRLKDWIAQAPSQRDAAQDLKSDAPDSPGLLNASGSMVALYRKKLDFYDHMNLKADSFAALQDQNRTRSTFSALEAIANRLRGMPGRKNLVWITGSVPVSSSRINELDRFERTIRALNDANVSVYAIAAAGLSNPVFVSAEMSPRFTRSTPLAGGPANSVDGLAGLAERTGGRYFYDSNDLPKAVRTAIDETALTYTLAYYPTTPADGKFHEIKVKVKRKGVELLHRRGYVAWSAQDAGAHDQQDDIQRAVWSPLPATGIGVEADVLGPPAASRLHLQVLVKPQDLTFNEVTGEAEPHWSASVDLAFLQRDGAGKNLGITDQLLQFKLDRARLQKVFENGLRLDKQLEIRPGAAELRVIVRDQSNGNMGSVIVPLAAESAAAPRP